MAMIHFPALRGWLLNGENLTFYLRWSMDSEITERELNINHANLYNSNHSVPECSNQRHIRREPGDGIQSVLGEPEGVLGFL